MSAKREAQYDIDQKTLQHKSKVTPSHEQGEAKQSTQQQKQRKQICVDDDSILAVKKDGEQQQKPTQNGNHKKQEAKPASSNLFSNLFTNNAKTTNGSGLFPNTSNSLFSNNSSGLFSKPTGGLFSSNGNTNQPKTGGLFTSNGPQKKSIFDFQSSGVPPIKNTGSSLFGGSIGTPQGNEQDDSGDSAQLEAAQNLEADPTKSTVSYKYEQTCELILKQKAFKFKKLGGDLIQNVDIVITQEKATKLYYISVQLPATKKSIYSGVLIQSKSQVKHLNNKKENVQISAFTIVKGKPQQAVLRCQFEKEQQGIELHDTVDKIVKGTYVSKQQVQKSLGQCEKVQSKQEVKKSESVQDKN